DEHQVAHELGAAAIVGPRLAQHAPLSRDGHLPGRGAAPGLDGGGGVPRLHQVDATAERLRPARPGHTQGDPHNDCDRPDAHDFIGAWHVGCRSPASSWSWSWAVSSLVGPGPRTRFRYRSE